MTKTVKSKPKGTLRVSSRGQLSAPALRALVNAKITSLSKLSKHTESDIPELHGMGPSSIPKLKAALKKKGLTFKKS